MWPSAISQRNFQNLLFAAPDILSAQMSNRKTISYGDRPLRVLISAGEASGEMYGAELLAALRELHAEAGNACAAGRRRDWGTAAGVECFGMGGERMREAGCELVVDARDVAVVGLFEVLSHLPGIYREFHKLLAEVDRRRPDVAVLIDFPDWNFRLAKQLHRRGIPVVYYVSPQLWAWRKGRLKLVQRYVAEMLVIIPFEREFYARNGVRGGVRGASVERVGAAHGEPGRICGALGAGCVAEVDCAAAGKPQERASYEPAGDAGRGGAAGSRSSSS